MLVEQGALEEHEDGWSATDRLATASVPDSIHGVIAARIDLLEAAERDALRRCSVMGRNFWPSAVGIDDDVLAGLGRRGIVFEQAETSFSGRREFAFKHALTHDVTYASLPRVERRDLHRRVAEWISDSVPDRHAETTELVAYHYEQALRYGGRDDDLERRSFDALVAAGDAAVRRGAYTSAERLLSRALELAPDEVERTRALLLAARADVATRRYERAVDRLDETIRVADRSRRHEPARRCSRLEGAGELAPGRLARSARLGSRRSHHPGRASRVGGAGARARSSVPDRDAPRAARRTVDRDSRDRGRAARGRTRGGGERAHEHVDHARCRRKGADERRAVRGDRARTRRRCPRRSRPGGRELPLVGCAARSARARRAGRERCGAQPRRRTGGRGVRAVPAALARRPRLCPGGTLAGGRRRSGGSRGHRQRLGSSRLALARDGPRTEARRPRAGRSSPARAPRDGARERGAAEDPADGLRRDAARDTRRREKHRRGACRHRSRAPGRGDHAPRVRPSDRAVARRHRGSRQARALRADDP